MNVLKICGVSLVVIITLCLITVGIVFLKNFVSDKLFFDSFEFKENYFELKNQKYLESVDKYPVLPYKVVFTGTVRDVGKYLSKTLKNLNILRSMFKYSEVIIFENDSEDNTLEILEEYKKKSANVHLLIEKGLDSKLPERTERLAYGRNKYIDYIEKTQLDKSSDYMIVMDLDDVNLSINFKEFYNSFKTKKEWDMIGSNQYNYYDIWALRTKKHNKNKHYSRLTKWLKGYNKYKMYFNNISSRSEFQSKQFYEVLSCFGGIGIYNIKKIRGCRYDSLNGTDCEHVLFHKCMRENYDARIFINTKLQNIGYYGIYIYKEYATIT
jgi:glycosyltransferase involved in cell wall biosynthesis